MGVYYRIELKPGMIASTRRRTVQKIRDQDPAAFSRLFRSAQEARQFLARLPLADRLEVKPSGTYYRG